MVLVKLKRRGLFVLVMFLVLIVQSCSFEYDRFVDEADSPQNAMTRSNGIEYDVVLQSREFEEYDSNYANLIGIVNEIISRMSKEEKMEVQAIYDATGIPRYLEDDTRPFRQPHPMIPKAAFLGGGKTPTAGEITLAHHGILFLDEFMEFKTECIEALRQPLEDGTIDITRNGIYHKFPADFQLIATMNPCPCGYGLEDGICRCTYHEKKRYLKKLSGPILDRFDMVLCLSKKEADTQKIQKESQETSHQIKERIETTIQREKKLLKNYQCSDTSHLSHIQLNKLLHLSKECKEILDIAYRSGKITRRGMDKILKVALTIMLMENESEIKPIHLMEAMTFRNTGFIKEVLEYGR